MSNKVATEDTLQKLLGQVTVITKSMIRHFDSYADIQDIVDAGLAREFFDIGDVINIKYIDDTPEEPVEYSVPLVVAHIGDVVGDDGNTYKDALWLMWMYATPQTVAFDAAEAIVETESTFQEGFFYYTKNDDGSFAEQTVTAGDAIPTGTTYYKHVRTGMTGRLRYGSNDYTESAYRQWLNSGAEKGKWWNAQHESDVAPAQAATMSGFMKGFEPEFLAIVNPVEVKVACNTVCDSGETKKVYDKFFLPSVEQMYGSPQAKGAEGDYFEYWKNETGLPSPSNGSSSNTNDAREIPSIANPDGAAVRVRLRSAYRSSTSNAWHVNSAGYLYGNSAYNAYRAQPVCVIYKKNLHNSGA